MHKLRDNFPTAKPSIYAYGPYSFPNKGV